MSTSIRQLLGSLSKIVILIENYMVLPLSAREGKDVGIGSWHSKEVKLLLEGKDLVNLD